nr:polyketide synthase [Burkholderia gladioli]
MVWLKTLERALADGDTIYGVVRGIAVNNDGRTAGPAAPNLAAQKQVMERALARSGLRPGQIGHIEVNGSGTLVTDLLELKAIEAVYRAGSAQPCELGSVKPNIGHPLCAEGIASFIKGVLMLNRRQRVPFLSAREPLAHYDLDASPFRFARHAGDAADAPTALAINCFADGGTNAHVIVQAWQETGARAVRRAPIAPPALERVDCRPASRPAPVPANAAGASVTNIGTHGAPDTRGGGGVWKRFREAV